MIPTEKMQEIQASRERLLERQTSKLSRKLINEVADELHQEEMEKHKLTTANAMQNAASWGKLKK